VRNTRTAAAFLSQFVLLSLATAVATAQTAGSGTINGTITDPSGAAIPAAGVVVHNADTGSDRAIQSNDSGVYSAPFLQPGNYDITVSKAGFTKVDRKGITVEVGRTLTIDFKMTVQTGTETVTVTSEAPVVDAEKTDVSQEVSQTMVQDLPLVGRRWESFVLLTPAVASDGALVSYRGLSGLYNSNSVDGANNNQSFFSEARGRSNATTGVPYIYSLDAIREFQVSSSNFSAEFGEAAGGVVNAVTKSGGNSMHGDLFYFLRYPSLNALDPVQKANHILTQTIHQQQQFGGSVGGALIKDKLFYFLNYDGSRRVFPVAYISTSTFPLPCPAQLSVAQCGAANGYLSGLLGAYARTGVNDIGFGKLDYQVNASNHVSLAFDLDDYHAPNGYSSSATYSNLSVTANGPIVLHERFLVGNWDSTPKSNMVNNLRFQWGMDNEIAGANSGGPSVGIASVMTYGMPNALPREAFPNERRWQQADTLSWTIGKHTVKFGVDVNQIHEVIANLFQGGGIYSYAGSATAAFQNWALDVFGINTGDGNTGRHYNSFVQVTDPITHLGKDEWWENDFGGFIEDSWKIKSNLTLNYGIRYEVQLTPQPPRPNTLSPFNAAWTSHINEDTNNFGPRIGIAYNPMKDTVVRLGYGMFYGKTTNSTFYAYRVENGIYQQTFNCGSPAACPGLAFPNILFTPPGPTPAAPFPGALTPVVTPISLPLSTQLVRGMTRDFVNPLVHEGDLTLERQLPGNMSLSAGWLFSRGLHLPVFVDTNLGPAVGTKSYAVLNSSGGLANTVTVPWYPAGDRIDTSTGDVLTGYSVANSWYNAMVLSLRRPMSHGVEFLVNYTFSKSTDDGEVAGANGTFNGTDWPLDPHNQKRENSLSDLYQKHRFTGSVIYTPLNFHKLSNRAEKAILDGWAFSLVMTKFTAAPVFAQISGFPGGGVDYGVTGGEVTNTGGSTGGRPPMYGRNVILGHGLTDVDFRITRDFALTEKYHLQFLGEAFNIFNHTNITAVNGTAFNYAAAGSATCPASVGGGTNGCLIPNATFYAPTASNSSNGLYGARQLQISAKFIF
jgi:Carboxypeptidase regulatory-like domain/TonB dependent receptor